MTTKARICFPVLTNEGIKARISDYYGKAPFHLVVDAAGKVVAGLNKNPGKQGGGSMPLGEMLALGVTQVICKDIGRRAHGHLVADGISVKLTEATTVEEAIFALNAGKLVEVNEGMLIAHERCQNETRG